MELGLAYSIVGFEIKELLLAGESLGIPITRLHDEELKISFPNGHSHFPQTVLMRSISNSRSAYLSAYLESCGSLPINGSQAISICGDKALTSMKLSLSGIPTPKTCLSFSGASALESMNSLTYPCVVKPVVGSWGRLVHKINDSDSARAVIEYKDAIPNPMHKIYYVQEYVKKPGRDIRAIVCGMETVAAIYRLENGDFRTNHHLGSHVLPCPLTPEISEICAKVGGLFGGTGIFGVDLVESESGLQVIEVNHTPEFSGCQKATGVKIAEKMLLHAIGVSKN